MYGGGMIESLRRRQRNLNALRARSAPQSEINSMAKQVKNLQNSIALKQQQTSVISNVVSVANQAVVAAEKVAESVNKPQNTPNNSINKAKLSQLANTASKLAANIKSLQNMKGGKRRRHRTHRRRN